MAEVEGHGGPTNKELWWAIVRLMALASFAVACVYPLFVGYVIPDDRVDPIVELAWPLYLFLGGVISVYLGATVLEGKRP